MECPSVARASRQVKIVVLALAILTFTAAQVYAAMSGQRLWVKNYNSRLHSPFESQYSPIKLAVDRRDNVYVGGTSASDYAVIKYGPRGDKKWIRRYDGPSKNWDELIAMAVGGRGNIFVTGKSYGGPDVSYEIATVKYDQGGNVKWARRYAGPVYEPSDIAVDVDGNVYVCGYGEDYVTLKYNPKGDLLWVRTFDSGSPYDTATALAVDKRGNVIVTGNSWGGGKREAYLTIKYDGEGNLKWTKRYPGPKGANFYQWPTDIKTDSAGNVYITGNSAGATTWMDWATLKYRPGGRLMWVKRVSGPSQYSYYGANALTLDSSTNVYVTGYTQDTSAYHDLAVIKYDSAGNKLWLSLYEGPAGGGDVGDGGDALVVDKNLNVFVAGLVNHGPNTNASDYLLVKFAPNGAQQWVQRFRGTAANGANAPSDMGLDSLGNIYVTGHSYNAKTKWDITTIKYAP